MCSVEWIYSELVNIAFEEEERKRKVAALIGGTPASERGEAQAPVSAPLQEARVPMLARVLAAVFRSSNVGIRA